MPPPNQPSPPPPSWSKKRRIEGDLCSEEQGMAYREHFLRKFVRGRAPEIMPNLNTNMAGKNYDAR